MTDWRVPLTDIAVPGIDGIELAIAPGLHVAAVEPIGNYALRLSFSDGHDRGIYPWSYLRELIEQQANLHQDFIRFCLRQWIT